MLQRLVNGPAATEVQETAFSLDVLGRYLWQSITLNEASGGCIRFSPLVTLSAHPGTRPRIAPTIPRCPVPIPAVRGVRLA